MGHGWYAESSFFGKNVTNMAKILIADGEEEFLAALTQVLTPENQVRTARDGGAALELARQWRPDALVLDAQLPVVDGLGLLRQLYQGGLRPAVLVTARFISGYIQDSLAVLGVDYLLRKPCSAEIAGERVEELLHRSRWEDTLSQRALTELLLSFGIPGKLRGCKYLREAICMMHRDPSQYITKQLYPAVGKQFGVDGLRVERCIRNAIHVGWESGDTAAWEKYFHGRPTNGEFIVRLAQLNLEIHG
jgi:CheY-like chemotaxis protein